MLIIVTVTFDCIHNAFPALVYIQNQLWPLGPEADASSL